METLIAGVKIVSGVGIVATQIYIEKQILHEVKPGKLEEDRREKSKTDPNVKWDRFDELSYCIRILLFCNALWLQIVVVILWSVFCSLI